MAAGARHFRVQACEAKTCCVVTESRRLFPGRLRVTGCAIGAQLILVHIGVARSTGGSKSQESLVEILHEDFCSSRSADVFWRVATGALQFGVLSLECKSRLRFVVEFGLRLRPAYECKIPSAMFGVTSRAIIAAGLRVNRQAVVTAFFRNALLDFHVAGHAFQLRSSCAERVATRASQKTIQTAMRLRERTGRNLSIRRPGEVHKYSCKQYKQADVSHYRESSSALGPDFTGKGR